MSSFEIGQEHFVLDGREHQIISGAMHYFRIHPDQWEGRIATAKAMGLNTIETYVAWNFHSAQRGEFRLDGQRDLTRFLRLVQDAGMHAIVRPGPYICAEWDNGGIPAWLLADPDVQMRRDEPRYLAAVQEYMDALLPVIAPLQVHRGGPVLMIQVENEYGAYGEDKVYLRKLVDMLRGGGITVPLFTCDQADDEMLSRGGLPELHRTATFGSRSLERLQTLRRHQTTGPLMCMEYWNGWFDAWGEDHHVTDPHGTGDDLRELLSAGASVNLYMVHGGTNFGFTSGANDKGSYRPTITSYDYDAPMAEDGTPTPKYDAMQAVIRTHRGLGAHPVRRRTPAPTFVVTQPASTTSLWAFVDRHTPWGEYEEAPTHEQIGALSGFSLYRTWLDLPAAALLTIGEARDRVQVFVNRQPVAVLDRAEGARAVYLPATGRATVELLVEDQGRVNYGPRIGEPKGVIGPVLVDGRPVHGWQAAALPIEQWAAEAASTPGTPATAPGIGGPALSVWHLDGQVPADLFLETSGFGKGMAWFNDWNLGRYWGKGPQETLYVPAPLVREEGNTLVVLELSGAADAAARFVPGPRWSTTTAD
ncbi:beta-galactosidase family protein [Georgenia phoenicis]|uniref:glycoside hydrolase family 35 protein n=1 Tax=unclassified Georgenia TaxID=2626815 RepID=UPI0039AE9632